MVKVAIVYHSGFGHTERLAQSVARGASDGGALASLHNTDDLYQPDAGPWETLAAADAIVFGSATYMGAASASFKAFADASSRVYKEHGWKDKLAAGFTNSGTPSGDKAATLNQFMVLACQHGMNWVSPAFKPGYSLTSHDYDTAINRTGHYTGVGTQSFNDHDPTESPNSAELETGRLLGVRVAEATQRWNR